MPGHHLGPVTLNGVKFDTKAFSNRPEYTMARAAAYITSGLLQVSYVVLRLKGDEL